MMSYYVAPSMVGKYGGQTLILEWLDRNGARIGKKQHITLKTDSYQIMEKKSPSLTKNPNALVTEPTVQCEESGMYVVSVRMPQSGENVLRYEIALQDADGNAVKPGQAVYVYLPYPDEKGMEDCLYDEFAVFHQLTDGSYEEYSTENGKLELTPYGLRMEVSSFSPYFLSWAEGAPQEEILPDPSELPSTGDRSHLPACLAALAASAAGIYAMKKKHNQ
jgi:hypothetical protein